MSGPASSHPSCQLSSTPHLEKEGSRKQCALFARPENELSFTCFYILWLRLACLVIVSEGQKQRAMEASTQDA